MSGHLRHQLRLTASRTRPHLRPRHGSSFQHDWIFGIRPQPAGHSRDFSGADVANGLLRSSEWLITNIHQVTGTPWFISIPLAALVVSACIRAPLTLYSHRMACKRAKLGPLIQAQTAMIGLGLRKKAVSNLRERVASLMAKRTKALMQTFAGSERTSLVGGLVTLPVFVSNLEVIRRMCGGPRGLLGRLAFGTSAEDATHTGNAAPEAVEAVRAATTSAIDSGDVIASASRDVAFPIPIEPTFATEGCLWFPNLLESDPVHILPFAVSAMLIANMIPDSSAARRELFGLAPVVGDRRATLLGQTSKRRAFQRTMLVLALAIGPITMDMPAALHLYWFTSAGFSLMVSKGIKRAVPIPKNTIKPCQGMEIPLLRPKPI